MTEERYSESLQRIRIPAKPGLIDYKTATEIADPIRTTQRISAFKDNATNAALVRKARGTSQGTFKLGIEGGIEGQISNLNFDKGFEILDLIMEGGYSILSIIKI